MVRTDPENGDPDIDDRRKHKIKSPDFSCIGQFRARYKLIGIIFDGGGVVYILQNGNPDQGSYFS